MSYKKMHFQSTNNQGYPVDDMPNFETQSLPGYIDGVQVLQMAKPERVQIDSISDVVYSQVKKLTDNTLLRMSLLIPRTDQPKPAILFFPGGGFTTSERGKLLELRLALAQAGFVVASAEYRVVPDVFPAPVIDGKTAVRFLRANAKEFGIDVTRVGVLGNSAGGWLSAMLGTTNQITEFDQGWFSEHTSDVQAAATLYGISNLLNIGEGYEGKHYRTHLQDNVTEALLVNGVAFSEHLGGTINSDKAKALYASPMGHIRPGLPPFLIMHGSQDTLVSPVQSSQLYQTLQEDGVPADYYLIEGAEHGDLSWYQDSVIQLVVNWFIKTLVEDHNKPDDSHPADSASL
ncbi:alpha/beta hydrolase [Vibrio tritonius]|uniref:alpha/beta hydrolase n=1 Tax=Vibrio tritonius TaxID=1435069 RepID=UPI00315CDA25